MRVTLLYFDGCPSWETARERLGAAARQLGIGVEVDLDQVETVEEAQRWGFTGSPTILLDGIDPFVSAGAPPALACRVYATTSGLSGSPTTDQLVAALSAHLDKA